MEDFFLTMEDFFLTMEKIFSFHGRFFLSMEKLFSYHGGYSEPEAVPAIERWREKRARAKSGTVYRATHLILSLGCQGRGGHELTKPFC